MKPYLMGGALAFLAACSEPSEISTPISQPTAIANAATETVTQGIGYCNFSERSLSFAGTATDQALCLLTPVKRYAHLGTPLERLPQTLRKLMNNPQRPPSRGAATAYLSDQGLSADMMGGPVSGRIAKTPTGKPARYFVIHDTSSPNLKMDPFPEKIDTNSWVNSFHRYEGGKPKAHIFINREGVVRQFLNFSVPWRATKLESKVIGVASRGRFIHIELIQPRRSDPKGRTENDHIAPMPGFSAIQYTRLAQAYVIASVRAERWLIPAYHTTLDTGLEDGHDDPQNFDLLAWDTAISAVLKGMK